MIQIVAALGVLMCALGLLGLATPASLVALGSRVVQSRPLRIAAVALRIVLGAILIIAAGQTPYPWPMKILGVIFIMAGTVMSMVNRATLDSLVERIRSNPTWGRGLSLAALAVGAFLAHAAA